MCPPSAGGFSGSCADRILFSWARSIGLIFEGHPDPRRILLSEDWEGHPLRKDYAVDTPHAPYR